MGEPIETFSSHLTDAASLEDTFVATLSAWSADDAKIKSIFQKIVKLYSQADRHYHNLNHIRSILSFLHENRAIIHNSPALFLAAWYHDVVYDSKSKTNEHDSAEMMKSDMAELAVPTEVIDFAYAAILATQKHQQIIGSKDEALFLDADLSILAAPANIYAEYCANVRKEYSWVPEDLYKNGRKLVLAQFLEKDEIYFSDTMKSKNLLARENIKKEISSLS